MTSVPFNFYHYTPSLEAAIVSTIVFGVCTVVHTYLIGRHKSLYFIPLVIGGSLETVGYVCRCLGHYNPTVLITYIIQSTFILVGPVLFAATIYMILARVIRNVQGEHHSFIPIHILTKTFVIGDVVITFITASGGGLLGGASKSPNLQTVGKVIILTSLAAQILWLSLFTAVTVVFHRRITQQPTEASRRSNQWRTLIFVLYACTTLIVIRCIVRMVEFGQGSGIDGYLLTHEVFPYLLDALPMAAVMVLLIVRHPAATLRSQIPEKDSIRLDSRQETV